MHPSSAKFLSNKDEVLKHIIELVDFPAINNTYDVFEDLCSCILDMRIHYAPSPAAFRYPRLKRLIQGAPITPELIMDLPDDVLLPLKLSHQKHTSLRLWAEKWIRESLEHVDWHQLSDQEVMDRLSDIKGVSDWTKYMILLFTLERPDIFPVNDYQLKKAFCECYGLEEDHHLHDRMMEIAQRWSPHRSLACRYLWRWRRRR